MVAKSSSRRRSLPKAAVGNAGHPDFPVVGIGASAGGLEALEQFLSRVPTDSGLAFVVVQHLDPTRPGLLVEVEVMAAKV